MAEELGEELNEFTLEVVRDIRILYTLITGSTQIESLTNLDTNTKASLVSAINEVLTLAEAASGSGGAIIDDGAARTSTTYSSSKIEAVAVAKAGLIVSDGTTANETTWSSLKINNAINAVSDRLQAVLADAPEVLDSFKEVADYIASDKSGATAMTSAIQNRIRVDADQNFTSEQIAFGLGNLVKLGVARQSELTALKTALGDTSLKYKDIYLAAKNA